MNPLLIELSQNLPHLDWDQLQDLSDLLRQSIIDIVSLNGGHLGSNLGVIELTLALHKVFSSPKDKFIFDVSHQTYPHKILTGRAHQFPTIRQFKGLCGFASPAESFHDHFYSGHAGTALSLGLGMAKSRDLQKGTEYVLPILGDASLTCGLTLEALNNVPLKLSRFIVILNDNQMSISYNVGAVTQILNRYLTIEQDKLDRTLGTPSFFEQFGLRYHGPIDGHNLKDLVETLEDLKDQNQPILLHIKTLKGKGMEAAIHNPITYHGCRPFDKITGKFYPPSSMPTFPQIFGRHLSELASRDERIVTVTPAMPAGSCLENFMQQYPDRCLDVGIAEGHAVTFCGGLAYGKNLKVIASIYATFLQRALDNLFQDVCLQNLPVIFAIDRAGLSPGDGSTHHGIYDIGFLKGMPNLTICQPRDGHLLKELLESALHWNCPTAIRYPNLATHDYPETPFFFREIGKGEVLIEGEDLVIIALGHMHSIARTVCDLLSQQGLRATLIDPIFVKPMDEMLFERLLSSHRFFVTIEEHAVSSGVGSLFNSLVMRLKKQEIHVHVLNFGIPDRYFEHGTYSELLNEAGLKAESIVQEILRVFTPLISTPLTSHDHCSIS
jgi:1-deoxy-D-xylulose-5-phosphate synthase